MTGFGEFPLPNHVAQFPNQCELRDYFRACAKVFGLYERYGNDWRIATRTVCGEEKGKEQSRIFGGLLIANGTLQHPNIPELPGFCR